MACAPNAKSAWDRCLARLREHAWRFSISASTKDGVFTQVLEMDVSQNRFVHDSRWQGNNGTIERYVDAGDGEWQYGWKTDDMAPAIVDRQPALLADALQHPLAALLDYEYVVATQVVTMQDDVSGSSLVFTRPEARSVIELDSGDCLPAAYWKETPAGKRELIRQVTRHEIDRVVVPAWREGVRVGGGGWSTSKEPDRAWRWPDWAVARWPDGQVQALSQVRQRVPLVVVFWSADCYICRRCLYHIAQIAQRFGESVDVVSINEDANEALAHAYSESRRLPYPVVWNGDSHRLGRMIGATAVPYVVVTDREWNIRYRGAAVRSDEIESAVCEVMG